MRYQSQPPAPYLGSPYLMHSPVAYENIDWGLCANELADQAGGAQDHSDADRSHSAQRVKTQETENQAITAAGMTEMTGVIHLRILTGITSIPGTDVQGVTTNIHDAVTKPISLMTRTMMATIIHEAITRPTSQMSLTKMATNIHEGVTKPTYQKDRTMIATIAAILDVTKDITQATMLGPTVPVDVIAMIVTVGMIIDVLVDQKTPIL